MNQNVKVGVIVVIIIAVISFLIAMVLMSGMEFGGELDLSSKDAADVALIRVEGAIQTEAQASLFGSTGASSTEIVEQIESAAENDKIKAVFIEINSPGGTVVASKEIGNALKRLDKPSVSFIREVGASGGYWIASATDYIVADPLSITGSIGVIGSYLSFGGFLEEYNITYEQLIGGKHKDIGSPYKDMTAEERKLMQERIDIIHDAFITEISENRDMSYEDAAKVSTGIFYLGKQAYDLGLVDELGDKETAKEYLKIKLNVSEINIIEYQKQPSFFEALSQVMSNAFFSIGKGISAGFMEIEQKKPVLLV